MMVPRHGFASICVLIWSPAALAALAFSDRPAGTSEALPFLTAQTDNAPDDKPSESETNQEKPPEPPVKAVCYREVNQANCDCMMYEKTGSSQWRPVDCVADTVCESPEHQCE